MPAGITNEQAQALATNPYAQDGKLTDQEAHYQEDLAIVKSYITQIRTELTDIKSALTSKQMTKVVLSLPDFKADGVSHTHLSSTAQKIHAFASSIKANNHRSPESDIDNSRANNQVNVRNALINTLQTQDDIKIKGDDLAFKFTVKPFQTSQTPVNGGRIESQTSMWGTALTSLSGKHSSKLPGSQIDTANPKTALSNTMIRSVKPIATYGLNSPQKEAFQFGRAGFWQPGQGSTVNEQIDILQKSTGKTVGGRHFDLRLMNPDENKKALAQHKATIDQANKIRQEEGKAPISTCTIPINQNKMTFGDELKQAPVMLGNFIKHNGFSLKSIGAILATAIATPIALAVATVATVTVAPAIYLNSLRNDTLNIGAMIEWLEAKDGITNQLEEFKAIHLELQEEYKHNPSTELEVQLENAKQLLQITENLTNAIYNKINDGEGSAPDGMEGLMLSALMMKTADALGMSVSEGCKSNKDRATVVDMMVQAMEFKNKDNPDSEYQLLDFSEKEDRTIFKDVVLNAATRETSLNNTGVNGNLFFSGDLRQVLGSDGLRAFTGDAAPKTE
ncbi:inositol phosphate phosphatase SopB [uncultured Shewanella sp.]|uniref:inositol phosphate phosphatase SopB n=1 Tax=uncultured Shewanella sp. TaxID=173975 RepID=UPI002635B504|nr:inositol phosphate phosphatase SopB [uncultured Shewanella sp.]